MNWTKQQRKKPNANKTRKSNGQIEYAIVLLTQSQLDRTAQPIKMA